MGWPSKDPADYHRTVRPGQIVAALVLALALLATLAVNALAVGDVVVAPALTAVLGAVLVRRHRAARRQRPQAGRS